MHSCVRLVTVPFFFTLFSFACLGGGIGGQQVPDKDRLSILHYDDVMIVGFCRSGASSVHHSLS